MKLLSFRVFNFRSVIDSGEIAVDKLTCLVGRNESGKTNLLLALYAVNPFGGVRDLRPIKDFPRHKRLTDCAADAETMRTAWKLSGQEAAKLGEIFPRAAGLDTVIVTRAFSRTRGVAFPGLPEITLPLDQVKDHLETLRQILASLLESLDPADFARFQEAVERLSEDLSQELPPLEFAALAKQSLTSLRQVLAGCGLTVPEPAEEHLNFLESLAEATLGDNQAEQDAAAWILESLPLFIYVDEYPELCGHQNIADYLARKSEDRMTAADVNFERLCKVAGLDPAELDRLLKDNDRETRSQLANRAGAAITAEIKRLWKDRALKIRFNLDGDFCDTLVSDPTELYDVEVNLDERSRGFKWFFSFFVTFAAETKGGAASDAILLLDEPGLYFHAASQADMVRHLSEDFDNQVVYTTHSPFMIPAGGMESVRIINIEPESGTTAASQAGDRRTLFPLQASLGYAIFENMFSGGDTLVVESLPDFWILSAVSEYLRESGQGGLSAEIVITPAGGLQNIAAMAALLRSDKGNVVFLLRDSFLTEASREAVSRGGMLSERHMVRLSQTMPGRSWAELDIEDLFDHRLYAAMVAEAYQAELKGRAMALNENVPRIVKRCEAAMAALGLPFARSRPVRLLLRRFSESPEAILTAPSKEKFIRLFALVNKKFKAVAEQGMHTSMNILA